MPSPEPKYVPKHRGAPPKHARTAATNVVKLSSIAVWATGLSVVGGVSLGEVPAVLDGTVDLQAAAQGAPQRAGATVDLDARAQRVSRSADRMSAAADAKQTVLSDEAGVAVTNSEDLSVADPRTLARALMGQYGLASSEFDCLDRIWTQESNWNVHADNPSSSAYGIPQALPGSKMSSAGPDWEHSAETQIRWGLGYIKNRYGSACNAWGFKAGHGWY